MEEQHMPPSAAELYDANSELRLQNERLRARVRELEQENKALRIDLEMATGKLLGMQDYSKIKDWQRRALPYLHSLVYYVENPTEKNLGEVRNLISEAEAEDR